MNNKYLTASTVTLFDAEIHPPPPPLRKRAFKALLAEEKIVAVAIATISGRGRKHKETTTEATDATPE